MSQRVTLSSGVYYEGMGLKGVSDITRSAIPTLGLVRQTTLILKHTAEQTQYALVEFD